METEQNMINIISDLKIQLLMFQKRIRDLEKLVKKEKKIKKKRRKMYRPIVKRDLQDQ